MAAPRGRINALAVDSTPAEAPTLLDTLSSAPAAAALVVAALGQDDREALRLAHSELRDAVGEATTKLTVDLSAAAAPTPARWPRLKELRVINFDLAALETLGVETWGCLHSLRLERPILHPFRFDTPSARALAAALPRMPALRALELRHLLLPDTSASELFRASSAEDAPQLRALTIWDAGLLPTAARALAATGWRLEELIVYYGRLGAAGLAALLTAPTFAIRCLVLADCSLDAAALLALANAPWPLEELGLFSNNLSAAAAAPALSALSRHGGLRRLGVAGCSLSAAGFKALVEAAWPALTSLNAKKAEARFNGPHALGAAAFAGFPALEELDLYGVPLGKAGASVLASRRWPRLWWLNLGRAQLGDAGAAALARGAWPALEELDLRDNDLGAPLTLEDARRWAPALVELQQ